jgi:riboflavin synthase
VFTGIVEYAGVVTATRDTPGGRRLTVDAGAVAEGLTLGASVALDGVCLTVSSIDGSLLTFDVITETLHRSTLGRLRVNDRVNLERSLRIGDRLDGHFVQGHIDGKATVSRRQVSPREWVLWFEPPADVLRYIVPKGSVAINGVSLTIAAIQRSEFSVALIPTTVERTTLEDLKVGDEVNVETDVLVRTVVHTLGELRGGGDLTEAKLREHGFL